MKKNQGVIQRVNVFDWIIIGVLFVFTLLAAYPFVYTLAGSFNDGLDFEYGGIWLFPRSFTFANYQAVFSDSRLYVAFINTAAVTIVGVVLTLVFTSCVSYAMSQKKLRGKKFFWTTNLITMFFGGGMVPYYILILEIGLYDNYLVYVLPGAYSVYNMIVITSFFRNIDEGIRESALIDGASEPRIWWSLYLPVSKPVLATVGLWVAVARWNAYLPTLLYTSQDESMWMLQYYLMRVIQAARLEGVDDSFAGQVTVKTVSFAAIIIAVIPIFSVYPFITKYFTKGIMLGSIKG